ncbi:MAG: thioredoxin domain-containing protein [Candidatus Taylorbacteria bacterium]|nr:thioredoxin domain-containing protein [Candidatus Taylorbacteria bacterium]
MNTKRIIFWVGFVIVLALIVWGLIAAINKEKGASPNGPKVGIPAPITSIDHVRGPENASVTFIEYSDFQCPACQIYHPIVENIFASSTVPIRMVYRHYPLPQHSNALISAQASEAASLQGKFWEMYHLLFINHTEWTELGDPRDVFAGYAQRIGLNVTKFKADMDGTVAKDAVQKQLAEGQVLGIYQTPTFFLNGKMIENPQSYEQFKTAIEAAAK